MSSALSADDSPKTGNPGSTDDKDSTYQIFYQTSTVKDASISADEYNATFVISTPKLTSTNSSSSISKTNDTANNVDNDDNDKSQQFYFNPKPNSSSSSENASISASLTLPVRNVQKPIEQPYISLRVDTFCEF
uniref:A-agglutinin anchorage subunit n=1 Tax=Syphacia muris TaxID=451379 RepID=A0A0N5AT63_9BILA